MINRKSSIHLQDFPDVSFLNDEKELVSNMDLIRAICSTALSIRDNKNLRVRLPLNSLTVIGKNSSRILKFKDIIAEEVNVKNIEIKEDIGDIAETKLQINFKKVGAKHGAKMKEITGCVKTGEWEKISDKEIQVAGLTLVDDEFEIKLMTKNKDDKNAVTVALPSNDYLIQLDIEVTQELEEEGIARDIVRAIQQNRKEADLNVSDRIALQVASPNTTIAQVADKFASYIKEQTLGTTLEVVENGAIQSKATFNNKIEDGDVSIGIELS
jgi:isoleucyl-tRNA synthetase